MAAPVTNVPCCESLTTAAPGTRGVDRVDRTSLRPTWRDHPLARHYVGGLLTQMSRSFCTTDDALVECMTCGVVGRTDDLEVRSVHQMPDEATVDPTSFAPTIVDPVIVNPVIVNVACPVCRSRGTIALSPAPMVGVLG
jgi:hypothetical protein